MIACLKPPGPVTVFFNLRRMRAGNPYCVLRDEAGSLRYFVYEASLRDYVVFDLTATPTVAAGQKPVQTELRSVSATVASSLWEALQTQGVSPELIVQLDDVFGQVVDLFYLQPGDEIRMVYEEILVDGQRAAPGRIRAARLVHEGHPYSAFYHETETRRGYFDETGRSLQRAFLRAPLKYTRISSGFSDHRLHPILNIYRKHHAIDYAAPLGTPVLAVGDGKVLRNGYEKNAGRYIRLRHGSRYESRYIHLSRFAEGVRPGRPVKRGEVIGYVGQTGLATGPHLDFAFLPRRRGRQFPQDRIASGRTGGRRSDGPFPGPGGAVHRPARIEHGGGANPAPRQRRGLKPVSMRS